MAPGVQRTPINNQIRGRSAANIKGIGLNQVYTSGVDTNYYNTSDLTFTSNASPATYFNAATVINSIS